MHVRAPTSRNWAETALDFGFSIVGVAVTGAYWPQYEGVSDIWGPEFLDTVRQISVLDPGDYRSQQQRYGRITRFLSNKLGSFEMIGFRYMPSELNLERAIDLLKDPRRRIERGIFEEYLRDLQLKGMMRTPQESRIWRVCGEALLRDPVPKGS